ncbi:hypothetical protein NQZ68_033165 [Dissostichus eleginoides]|nr:hypothetical protein NQZ68_033165 [Dissostichus eleginoides]
MRREGVQYWIQQLGELQDEGLFTGDFLDKALVQLSFMAIIQTRRSPGGPPEVPRRSPGGPPEVPRRSPGGPPVLLRELLR